MDFSLDNKKLNCILKNIDFYHDNWFDNIISICYKYGDLESIQIIKNIIYDYIYKIDDTYIARKHRSILGKINIEYKIFYGGFNECYTFYIDDYEFVFEISKIMALKKINEEFDKVHIFKLNEIIKHYIKYISPITDIENIIYSFI